MEQPITPEPNPGTRSRSAVSVGEPVVGPGRFRDFTPVADRSQRMHRFTGELLNAVADATAGGVEGVAVGCLNGREAGESVLELREAMARLKGLELALLARADGQDVCKQVEGVAAVDPAGWLAQRGLVSGRAARQEVRLSEDLTGTYAATGSALLAGDIDTKQAGRDVTCARAPGSDRGRRRDLSACTSDVSTCPAGWQQRPWTPAPRSARARRGGWPATPPSCPVVLGGKSEVLDHGRRRRLFTTPL